MRKTCAPSQWQILHKCCAWLVACVLFLAPVIVNLTHPTTAHGGAAQSAAHGHSHGHSHAVFDADAPETPYGTIGPSLFSTHDASDHEHQILGHLPPSGETAAPDGARLSLPPKSLRAGAARGGPRRPPRLA
jgi:hypothetical protein